MARKRRPKLKDKDELVKYLKDNNDAELPFNEEVWDRAVKLTEDKERKFREVQVTDFDGVKKVKKVPNGVINPVSKYFQLMALPQYRKPLVKEDEEDVDIGDIEVNFSDLDKSQTVSNWVSVFFGDYSKEDKKFLIERLGNYYDSYEFNEGADKLLVIKAVADELQIMKLTKQRHKNKNVEAVEKNLERVQKGFLSVLDSLKALKKNRSAMDEGKNKLTKWIDDMERAGDFKGVEYDFESDEIDDILETYEKAIIRVMRDG